MIYSLIPMIYKYRKKIYHPIPSHFASFPSQFCKYVIPSHSHRFAPETPGTRPSQEFISSSPGASPSPWRFRSEAVRPSSQGALQRSLISGSRCTGTPQGPIGGDWRSMTYTYHEIIMRYIHEIIMK